MAKRNKVHLTNDLVRNLKENERYYDIYDDDVRGFHVRISEQGGKSYRLRFTLPNGQRRCIRIGEAGTTSADNARKAAKAYWADAVRGIDPLAEKQRPKEHTLKSLLAVYGRQATSKTVDATIARVEDCFEPLLKKPLGEIRRMWVLNWRKTRLEAGRAPGTVNRDITALRSVLSFATAERMLPEHPLTGLKSLRTDDGGKPRYLSQEEEKRLYNALDAREEDMRVDRENYNNWCRGRSMSELPDLRAVDFADYLRPMTLLALNTGSRRGELFNLLWADVTLESEHPQITIAGAGAKSGKTRHIPLNAVALDVLLKWKAQTGGEGLVFKSPKTGERFDNIRKSWAALVKKAELQNFRFHDCRHHFASMLVQKGVDLNVVRELLGHSSLVTTLRYAYLSPANTAGAVALLDRPGNVVSIGKGKKQAT